MPSGSERAIFERLRLPGNPVADPRAVVVAGQARFTLLTARLLRLEWSATGAFEDRASYAFPQRRAAPPPFSERMDGQALTIETGALTLRYRQEAGPFTAENLSITFTLAGEQHTWRPGMAGQGNLRGTRRTLDVCDRAVALEQGLLSRDGWALFDDSATVRFNQVDRWVEPRIEHQAQDWYFFGYGHDYTAALADYTRFGGQIPLIPRYLLGAWWSRYWAYSAADLRQLVEDFRNHDLPLDVLVLDMDWHTTDSWTGYTWNRDLFPDPEGFLREMHERGLRITLNLHPALGVQPFEQIYPRFAQAMGIDPAAGERIAFRVADRRFMRHYFELLHHPLEQQGVDFWWLDWQQGEASELPGLDPLPWLNHLHFCDIARRGERPLLYSRWGGLGNHRYQIGFSGDTYATWKALRALPHFTATASNVAYGWWSHDIGGHFGATAPELFARWVQFGALSPCLRLHATRQDIAERRPWLFPKPVFHAVREAFKLRYRLIPYLYTMARIAADSGVSLCRPMYYAYPEHEAAYLARDQYMLGEDLLAAPIVTPADPATGIAATDVWVPPGEWYDLQNGERYSGPCRVRLLGGMERVPLLARAGAIIPLADEALSTTHLPANHLTLHIFPGETGSFRLYEDNGVSPDYRMNGYEWTPITTRVEGKRLLIAIGPAEGRCEGLPQQRRFTLCLERAQTPTGLLVGGKEYPWRTTTAGDGVVVDLPAHDRHAGMIVELHFAADPPWLPAEQHKRALVTADVARLLTAANHPTGDTPAELALTPGQPGYNDAVARLGGPFVSFLEYSAPEDAQQQLGHALVGAPADGSSFDLEIDWILATGGHSETRTTRLIGATGDQIIACPFAFASLAATHWHAEARLRWNAATIIATHHSDPICPGILHWRVLVYDASQTRIDPLRALEERENWEEQALQHTGIQHINEPFYLRFYERHRDKLEAGANLAACAVTSITLDEPQELVIAYVSSGPASFWLNDTPLESHETGEDDPLRPIFRSFHLLRKSTPVRLGPGEHHLVAMLERPPGSPWWYFTAGVAAV